MTFSFYNKVIKSNKHSWEGLSSNNLFNQIKIFVVNENGGLQFGSIVGLQYYKLLRGDTIMNLTG